MLKVSFIGEEQWKWREIIFQVGLMYNLYVKCELERIKSEFNYIKKGEMRHEGGIVTQRNISAYDCTRSFEVPWMVFWKERKGSNGFWTRDPLL